MDKELQILPPVGAQVALHGALPSFGIVAEPQSRPRSLGRRGDLRFVVYRFPGGADPGFAGPGLGAHPKPSFWRNENSGPANNDDMVTPRMSVQPIAIPIPAGTAGTVMPRQSTRSQTMQYGAGYVVFAAGRLLRDLAVARILGPAHFGMWGALLVYRQYSNYTDFGFT